MKNNTLENSITENEPQTQDQFILIPAFALHDQSLDLHEKTLLGLIVGFGITGRACHMSNRSIAALLSCSIRKVQYAIEKLRDLQLIDVQLEPQRTLFCPYFSAPTHANNAGGYANNSWGYANNAHIYNNYNKIITNSNKEISDLVHAEIPKFEPVKGCPNLRLTAENKKELVDLAMTSGLNKQEAVKFCFFLCESIEAYAQSNKRKFEAYKNHYLVARKWFPKAMTDWLNLKKSELSFKKMQGIPSTSPTGEASRPEHKVFKKQEKPTKLERVSVLEQINNYRKNK